MSGLAQGINLHSVKPLKLGSLFLTTFSLMILIKIIEQGGEKNFALQREIIEISALNRI